MGPVLLGAGREGQDHQRGLGHAALGLGPAQFAQPGARGFLFGFGDRQQR